MMAGWGVTSEAARTDIEPWDAVTTEAVEVPCGHMRTPYWLRVGRRDTRTDRRTATTKGNGMTGLMVLGIALIFAAAVVVYAALVMASRCDDQEERLRWERQRDAIAAAAEKARTRP